MDFNALADLLFPASLPSPEALERRYPPRDLPDGAMVTRFAPSPTGFVHFGAMFPVVTSLRLSRQSGGVFYLRIEDTDQKREVRDGVRGIIESLAAYHIEFDEGAGTQGERGTYGPYRQRLRAEIYHVFAKLMVQKGHAYPCFCSPERLEQMRGEQEAQKQTPGYRGEWALCREFGIAEVKERLAAGAPWVLRLKSRGDCDKRIECDDLVKGHLSMPENDVDHVLLKSDGIPTYHFAHAVDDHLMRTTHVVRGDEWLATLPLHLQLFEYLGFAPPRYLHISPLMKTEDGGKRKLSKRRDPEAALSYYDEQGYPPESVMEYTMTLLNSNFEEWRARNPGADIDAFPFSTAKMSVSGSLFDLLKLRDISRGVIAGMSALKVYEGVLAWAEKYDRELFGLLGDCPGEGEKIFSIGRGGDKPRKDLACWGEAREWMGFFFDPLFAPDYSPPQNLTPGQAAAILRAYPPLYDPGDSQEAWFAKLKELAAALGYAPEVKLFKKNPDAYPGHVGDLSMALRVAVTGKTSSPDLWQVMAILGKRRVLERIDRARAHYEKMEKR